MSTLRQAAQQALEALDAFSWEQVDAARTALRAALAEPEQEPVAWIDNSGHPRHLSYVQGVREKQLYGPLRPLYTAPTPRKPLTDEEIAIISVECAATHKHDDFDFARAIEKAHGIKEQEQ